MGQFQVFYRIHLYNPFRHQEDSWNVHILSQHIEGVRLALINTLFGYFLKCLEAAFCFRKNASFPED